MTAPRFTAQGKQVLFADAKHYADACDETAALAIVSALNAGWQDIASAPRDGTLILGLFRNFGQWTYGLIYWRESADGWFDRGELVQNDPVHWAALPDAPTPSPSVTREGGE